ncbi:MAG: hypothetical protein KDK39_02150 [Leptospiraceae bacterium]|nr:hypothetical protein [Leptospiraceae bacterium]
MIVKKLENPVYHKRERVSLPGRDFTQAAANQDKSFDQYLLEVFEGEVVQQGSLFSTRVTPLTRENLISLENIRA